MKTNGKTDPRVGVYHEYEIILEKEIHDTVKLGVKWTKESISSRAKEIIPYKEFKAR